jgi:adenosylcobinamide kinase / adenosylcobinamide-phosphate guanylyltransferase
LAGSAAASGRLTLVLGGARSGKSRYAESLVMALPSPWLYVATAEARDSEMAERVAVHQGRRGPSWTTVETPRDIAGALAANANTPALVDCLTLWLSNVLLADADVDAEIEHLDEALTHAAAPLVLVANEVGSGIVPDNALGRRFRDLQGLLNQRIVARADRVVLVVAGLPLTLKGSR